MINASENAEDMGTENKRRSNFEWLRILAMAMIVTLHYMFKGEVVTDPAGNMTAYNLIMWLVTSLSICAVDVYVLISGYFLVEAEFKPRRLLGLLIQVLEYGIIITVCMLLFGGVRLSELSVYDIASYIFPIGTEEYWFITAYFVMYLFSPLLSAGVKAISKKQFQILLIVLLGIFCVEKTILPMNLATDNAGYDFGWFMVLFLAAAYIRLYGIGFLEGKSSKGFITYFAASILIWAAGFTGKLLQAKTGVESFGHYADAVYDYNNICVLIAAVGLFYAFKNMELNEDGRPAGIARLLGPLTLGVYLLHEHILIRYRWEGWLGTNAVKALHSTILQLGHWLICVAVVMAVGLLVEWGRRKLTKK